MPSAAALALGVDDTDTFDTLEIPTFYARSRRLRPRTRRIGHSLPDLHGHEQHGRPSEYHPVRE